MTINTDPGFVDFDDTARPAATWVDEYVRDTMIATARLANPEADNDEQAIFSLICQMVELYANLTDDDLTNIERPTHGECAQVIGSVMANVAPGWVAGMDTAARVTDLDTFTGMFR